MGLAVIGFAACQMEELALDSEVDDGVIYASMEAMDATIASSRFTSGGRCNSNLKLNL